MRGGFFARSSVCSKRRQTASLHHSSPPRCKIGERSSESIAVCSSSFLLVESTHGRALDACIRNPATGLDNGLWVREGESGLGHRRLTRSIQRSDAVKSGEEQSIARLKIVSRALIAAQERTPRTRRFLCGFDAHSSPAKEGISPATQLYHTPIGYGQATRRFYGNRTKGNAHPKKGW